MDFESDLGLVHYTQVGVGIGHVSHDPVLSCCVEMAQVDRKRYLCLPELHGAYGSLFLSLIVTDADMQVGTLLVGGELDLNAYTATVRPRLSAQNDDPGIARCLRRLIGIVKGDFHNKWDYTAAGWLCHPGGSAWVCNSIPQRAVSLVLLKPLSVERR